jgi:ABC-2 type transport system ATP-binding protein
MKAIYTRNLSKRYWYYEKEAGIGGSIRALFQGKKVFVEAVQGIALDAEIGEIIGFIGPNGAGKTTTLKILSGILYPTSGHVEVMGFLPFRREKAFLSQITFVSGQRSQLFWDLPAEEYFNFCRVIYGIEKDAYQRNLKNLIELAEIGDILKVPQRKLSFGQRKRCELVGAFLHDPRLIFLDEPTNALDLINARKIREFIREKGKEGKYTIILTSHNLADIEQVCERLVIINMGKIVFDGKIQELNRVDGVRKQIKVVFDGPWTKNQVENLGKIIGQNGREVLLEVEADKASSVASILFTQFPIKDIGIASQPLETIIESIYKDRV